MRLIFLALLSNGHSSSNALLPDFMALKLSVDGQVYRGTGSCPQTHQKICMSHNDPTVWELKNYYKVNV